MAVYVAGCVDGNGIGDDEAVIGNRDRKCRAAFKCEIGELRRS